MFKNKKGFFDFEDFLPDLDMSPAYIALPLFGALIGFFTASGGFSAMVSGERFDPGIFTKIVATLGGAVMGYIAAWKFSD